MSADEEPSYVIAYSKPFDKNESLKESYYSQNDVLNMVSPKTKARLNKIITNQKQKYGNDMDIYVSIESPYRAYLSYGEGGADFVKNDNGVWEHDYGYIKIDSSLANAILSDVCKAAGMCDESLKESGNKNAFYVKPKKIDGLWRVVDVDDESKIKHAKRFEDEESCMKFIRKNARENNWVAGKEKEFKKTSDDKLTDLGKNVKKNIKDESICEDTVKQGNSWVNKGKEGTHGKFKTKKEADKQRAAMFANKKPGATWGK